MDNNSLSPIILNDDDPEEQFTFQEMIGEGAYGSVYKAIHKKSGRLVAIKVVPSTGEISSLQKEIQILKECKSQFIVKYFGSFYKDENLWLVMEYCAAGSVIDLIKITNKQLSEQEIAAILYFAIKGIDYLHQNKKIHRDIKAGNILLDHKGSGKLADFGVSAQLLHTNADKETKIGTPFWMSPEVISKHKYNQLTDIWSLGITAIEIAEGKPPLSHIHPMRAMFVIKNNPPQGLSEPQKWSKDFNDFVTACLKVDVSERPTAAQLLSNKFIIMGMKEQRRLNRLVDDSVNEIENYRLRRATQNSDEEQNTINGPQTMVSNHLSQGDNSHDSITHSSGTVIDVGTLIIKDEEKKDQQPQKDLDFVSYAKGMRMVDDMENIKNIKKKQVFQEEKEELVQEDEDENSEAKESEVIASMSLEEQEKFIIYLQQKMDGEIAKVQEKYLPKIKEIQKRIEEKKPKKQLISSPAIIDSGNKRLEQNLSQIIKLPFNFQVNQELLQKLQIIKQQSSAQKSSQLRSNPKPRAPFEFAIQTVQKK